MFSENGVKIIDVSGGLIGSRPANIEGSGFFIPQAAAIKEVINIPVIGVGGITTVKEAETIISSGRVDLVAVGRAILKDPKWATKAVKSARTRDQ
jgi:2,4-dienoyl-CoA reductase-like NADH-dependent reductase (Old Yellow Enzyme family)